MGLALAFTQWCDNVKLPPTKGTFKIFLARTNPDFEDVKPHLAAQDRSETSEFWGNFHEGIHEVRGEKKCLADEHDTHHDKKKGHSHGHSDEHSHEHDSEPRK